MSFGDFFASRDDDVFSNDAQRYYAADPLHPTDEAYASCNRRVSATVPLERWLAPSPEQPVRAGEATATASNRDRLEQ